MFQKNRIPIQSISDLFFILLVSFLYLVSFDFIIYPEFYNNGDNEFYQMAFYGLKDLSFYSFLFDYRLSLAPFGGSGHEPVSGIIFFIFSKIISFDVFHYLNTFLFVLFLALALKSFFDNWKALYLLSLSVFYVFIIALLTKRLSIAFIFGFVAIIYRHKPKLFILFIFLSILSHFQMLFVLPVWFLNNFKLNKKLLINVFLLSLPLASVLILWWDNVYGKFTYHLSYAGFDYSALSVFLWFLIASFFRGGVSYRYALIFLFLAVLGFFVGAGRVNLIGFSLMYFMLPRARTLILVLILLSPYFIYKHIDFSFNYYKPGVIFNEK